MTLSLDTLIQSGLPQLVKKIEIRSLFSPPQVFDVGELVAPGPTSPTSKLFRPTIIFSGGSLGQQVIAPAGMVSATAWKKPTYLLLGAGVVGLYVLIMFAYRAGQRRSGK